MAWRNFKDNNVVWFNSKGKTMTFTGGNTNLESNGELIQFRIDTHCTQNERFSLKLVGDSSRVEFTFRDTFTDEKLLNFVLTQENPEVHSILLDRMFGNSQHLDESFNLVDVVNFIVDISGLGENDYIEFTIYPYYEKISAPNFVDGKEGTASSLNQLLSVIKSELWYSVNFGLPLYDKISTKFQMDASVLQIVKNHSEVVSITNFESSISGHNYHCKMTIHSIYGDLQMII